MMNKNPAHTGIARTQVATTALRPWRVPARVQQGTAPTTMHLRMEVVPLLHHRSPVDITAAMRSSNSTRAWLQLQMLALSPAHQTRAGGVEKRTMPTTTTTETIAIITTAHHRQHLAHRRQRILAGTTISPPQATILRLCPRLRLRLYPLTPQPSLSPAPPS